MVLIGGNAFAVNAANVAPLKMYEQQATDVLASKFIGMRLFATENQILPDANLKPGAENEWDDIGEVNDVILSQQGEVKAVILGVGGFLGLGEKNVAIPMENIKFVKHIDDAEYFLVVNANKQMLTDAPAYVAPTPLAQDASKPTESAADEAAGDTNSVDTPAVATTDTVNPNAPVAGENSFTEAQAQERMVDAGYADLSDLKIDADGIWRATGTKAGAAVNIALDYQGNITSTVK